MFEKMMKELEERRRVCYESYIELKQRGSEHCYFYLGQAEGLRHALARLEEAIDQKGYVLDIAPGVRVEYSINRVDGFNSTGTYVTKTEADEEKQDMEDPLREEKLIQDILYQMDEIYMNVGKEYGLFSPVSLDVLKQVYACKDAVIDLWENSGEEKSEPKLCAEYGKEVTRGFIDAIRDAEKGRVSERNIHEIVREEFGGLKSYVISRDKMDYQGLMLTDQVIGAEERMHKRIEKLFCSDVSMSTEETHKQTDSLAQQFKNIVKEELDILKGYTFKLDKAGFPGCMFADSISIAGQRIDEKIESMFDCDTTKTQHKEQ